MHSHKLMIAIASNTCICIVLYNTAKQPIKPVPSVHVWAPHLPVRPATYSGFASASSGFSVRNGVRGA